MDFFKNKLNRNILRLVFLIIGLVLGIIICRYHADKFLIDDMLSFSLSNTPGGWVSHEVLGWIDNQEFQRFAVLNNPFDFKNVWLNQALDCHPPLYYLIIHIISSIFAGKLSYWYGYLPNIIFYLLSAVMVERLSYKLTKKYEYSFLAMFIYIVNAAVLDYVAFIRMYPLVSLFALLFSYIAIDFFNKENINKKTYGLLALITALGCLTHYYSYVVYFFISVVVGLTLLFKKEFKILFGYCLSVLGGIIVALLIFPASINHWLTNAHSVNAINNLGESLNTVKRFTDYLLSSPFGYLSLVLVLVIVVSGIIKKKIKMEVFSLIFSVVMYFLLIGKTSSFVTHRYMVPIDGIFISVIISAVCLIFDNFKYNLIIALAVVLYSGLPTVYIPNYQNPISFAKANYGRLLIVYSDQNWDSNYINVNTFEFREYENIYLMNDSEEARNLKADFFLYDKAVVYVYEGMDLDLVKNWLFGSSRFTKLEPTGITTSIYSIYYAE